MMTIICRFFLSLLTLISLTSCGFRPLYSSQHGYDPLIPKIQISQISSIEGAVLYDALTRLIENDDLSNYKLTVQISYETSNLAVSSDAKVIEEKVTQKIDYTLLDKDSGNILTSGKFSYWDGVRILFGPYVSYNIQRHAKENLAIKAATELQARLAIYFNKKHNK
jgi:hypothetical protein